MIGNTVGTCLEKTIGSNKMQAAIGNREYFDYYRTKSYHEQSEIIFHLPPHTEQSTFTLDFISMAYNKQFPYKTSFDKLQVLFDL